MLPWHRARAGRRGRLSPLPRRAPLVHAWHAAACCCAVAAAVRVSAGVLCFAGVARWQRPGAAPGAALARRAAADEDLAYRYEDGEQESDAGLRVKAEDLEVGRKMRGIVSALVPFGAFVDVGADRAGLVHVSRMSTGYISNIEEHVQRGQSVTVWVQEVSEDGKLTLSMIDPSSVGGGHDASMEALEQLGEDVWVDATVEQIMDFGFFISLEPPGGGTPVQALVHVSQIRDGFVDHPADEAEIGQKVRVRVLGVKDGKLKCSMRPVPVKRRNVPVPDISGFQGMSPTEWIQGRVAHFIPFGFFVEVRPPKGGDAVMGLVHVSQIRGGYVSDVAAEARMHQQVRVRVIDVDTTSGRLSLSMREPEPEAPS